MPNTGDKMNEFFSNANVQGAAYLARAFSSVVLDKRFDTAYDDVLKALAAFGLHSQIKKVASDLDTLDAKGELPKL
jgi:hypothetical protein